MNKSIAWIGLGIVAVGSSAAMAQSQNYAGGPGYGSIYLGASAGEMFYNEDGLGTMSPTVALFRVGEQFSPYVAIEGRIGTSVSGGDWNGYHVDAQLIYAGYVKGILPISPWISGYALAGLGGAQMHRDYPDSSSNDVGLSFGLGGEVHLGGGASLDLEYVRLTSGNNVGFGYSADMLTFGVNWRL